jgi:glycine cleavage system H protein
MTDPADSKFTETHEWVRRKGKTVLVGISEHLQQQLSDITNIELPEVDEVHYDPTDEICVIEGLNDTATLHAPIAGIIVSVNTELLSKPENINNDPYGRGWIAEMKPDKMDDLEDLMDVDEYDLSLPDDSEEEE